MTFLGGCCFTSVFKPLLLPGFGADVEFWEASPSANPTELIPAASLDPTRQGFVLCQEMLVVALTELHKLTQVWEEQPDSHFLVPDQCWD